MMKADKQLTVIHTQTELARQKHRELLLELRVSQCIMVHVYLFKDNEDNFDHEEYSLKSTTQSLKDELSKETKIRRICQGKVAANTEDLEKMKAEHRHTHNNITKEVVDKEREKEGELVMLEELTAEYTDKKIREGTTLSCE